MEELTYSWNATSFEEENTYDDPPTGVQILIDFTLKCCKNSSILIGFFANCFILLVFHSRHFLNPPPIFWVVVSFCKWGFLFQYVSELLIKVIREHLEDQVAIVLYFLVSFVLLSFIMLLAVDCYFEILDHQWWYKDLPIIWLGHTR